MGVDIMLFRANVEGALCFCVSCLSSDCIGRPCSFVGGESITLASDPVLKK